MVYVIFDFELATNYLIREKIEIYIVSIGYHVKNNL